MEMEPSPHLNSGGQLLGLAWASSKAKQSWPCQRETIKNIYVIYVYKKNISWRASRRRNRSQCG